MGSLKNRTVGGYASHCKSNEGLAYEKNEGGGVKWATTDPSLSNTAEQTCKIGFELNEHNILLPRLDMVGKFPFLRVTWQTFRLGTMR